MQIRRAPLLETIQPPPQSSFVLRRFRLRRLDFNWHYHPEIELTLILEGQGLRYVGHSIEPFFPGDLCLLGSNLPHSWVSARTLESVVIQFKLEPWQHSLSSWREMDGIRKLLETAAHGLRLEGKLRREVQERMLELGTMPPSNPTRLLRLLETLMLISSRPPRTQLSAASAVYSMRREVARRIQRVISHVEQNIDGEISHLDAAAIARMVPTAFSRFFKKHVGKTFEDYVNEVRVGQVCAELQQSEDSITDIALRCGFQNLANFNRRFRERLQMTPREYRKIGRPSLH